MLPVVSESVQSMPMIDRHFMTQRVPFDVVVVQQMSVACDVLLDRARRPWIASYWSSESQMGTHIWLRCPVFAAQYAPARPADHHVLLGDGLDLRLPWPFIEDVASPRRGFDSSLPDVTLFTIDALAAYSSPFGAVLQSGHINVPRSTVPSLVHHLPKTGPPTSRYLRTTSSLSHAIVASHTPRAGGVRSTVSPRPSAPTYATITLPQYAAMYDAAPLICCYNTAPQYAASTLFRQYAATTLLRRRSYALPRRAPSLLVQQRHPRFGHRQHARHHTADAPRPIVYTARWVWGGACAYARVHQRTLCTRAYDARRQPPRWYSARRRTPPFAVPIILLRVKRLRGNPEVERTEEHEGGRNHVRPRDVPEGGLAKSPVELDAERIPRLIVCRPVDWVGKPKSGAQLCTGQIGLLQGPSRPT
ncbi:hypothetical protein C8R44DRAFT_724536 [Mycena epipterygia]|nr:hypothetical protein C8R44DRAFT_724536 [Mycena epipterygia]